MAKDSLGLNRNRLSREFKGNKGLSRDFNQTEAPLSPEYVATVEDNDHRSQLNRGFVSSIDKFQAHAGRATRDVGRDSDIKGLAAYGQEVMDRNNAEAELNPLNVTRYEDVNSMDSALDYVGGMAGQAAASLSLAVPAVVGSSVSAPVGVAAGLATMAPVMLGESAEDIEDRTGTAPSVMQAAPAAIANTALEYLAPAKVFGKVLRASKVTKALPGNAPKLSGIAKEMSQGTKAGVLREGAKEAGKTAIYEGSTEAIQQMNNILAAKLMDNSVDISITGNASELLNNFLGGAIGGAGFGSMGSVAQAIAASPTRGNVEAPINPLGGGKKTRFDTQEDKANAATRESLRADIADIELGVKERGVDPEGAAKAIAGIEERIQATYNKTTGEFGKKPVTGNKKASRSKLESFVSQFSGKNETTKDKPKRRDIEKVIAKEQERLKEAQNDPERTEEQRQNDEEIQDLITRYWNEQNNDISSPGSYESEDFDSSLNEQEVVGTEVVGTKREKSLPSKTPSSIDLPSSLEKRFNKMVEEDSKGKEAGYESPLRIETYEDIAKQEAIEAGVASKDEAEFYKTRADALEARKLEDSRKSNKSPEDKAKYSVKLYEQRQLGDKEFLRAYSGITKPKIKNTAISENLENTDNYSTLKSKGIIVDATKNFSSKRQIKLPKGKNALDPFRVTVEGMKNTTAKSAQVEGQAPTVERVGTAFFEGLTALLSNPENPLEVNTKEAKTFFNGLSSDLIIFRSSLRGKPYTLGEFREVQSKTQTSAIDSDIVKTTKELQKAREAERLGKPTSGEPSSALFTKLKGLKEQKQNIADKEHITGINQTEHSGTVGDEVTLDNATLEEVKKNKDNKSEDPLDGISVKDKRKITAYQSAALEIQALRKDTNTKNKRSSIREVYKRAVGKDAPQKANPDQLTKILNREADKLSKHAKRLVEKHSNDSVENYNKSTKLTAEQEALEHNKTQKATITKTKIAKRKKLENTHQSLLVQLVKNPPQEDLDILIPQIKKVEESLGMRKPTTKEVAAKIINKTTVNKVEEVKSVASKKKLAVLNKEKKRIQTLLKKAKKQVTKDKHTKTIKELEAEINGTANNSDLEIFSTEKIQQSENLEQEPSQPQDPEFVEEIEQIQKDERTTEDEYYAEQQTEETAKEPKEGGIPPEGPITPKDLDDAYSDDVSNKLLKQAKSWLGIVGLGKVKLKIMTPKEALEHVASMKDSVKLKESLLNGDTRGFVTVADKNGVRSIFIHPMLKPGTMVETLAHEVGHIVVDHIINSISTKLGKAFNTALTKDFNRWVKSKTKSENDVIESFEGIKGANRQALLAVIGNKEETLAKDGTAYSDSQHEYMADNIATWLLNPYKKPKTAVERLFRMIAFHIKSLIGVSNPGAAETLFLDTMYARAPKLEPEINPLDLFGEVNAQLGVSTKLGRRTAEKMLSTFRKQVGETAFKKFQKDQKVSVKEMLLQLATLSDADAFGILTHAMYKHNLKHTISENQKRALILATQSVPVQRQLHRILASESPDVLDSLHDPEVAAAYMYQLWAGGQLNLGGRTKGIFNSIKKFLRNIIGIISEDEQARNVLNDVRNTQSLVKGEIRPNDTVLAYVKDSIADKFMKSHGATIKRWNTRASKLLAADSQLRRIKIPAVRQIADLMYHVPGAINKGSNYLRSKQARAGEFHYEVYKIRKNLSKKQRIELNRVLLNLTDFTSHTDSAINKAVEDTKTLFKSLRTYMNRAGLDVKDLGANYFPWVLDIDVLQKDPTGFLNLIGQDKFKNDHKRVAKTINTARVLAAISYVIDDEVKAEQMVASFKDTGVVPKGLIAKRVKAGGGLLKASDVPKYLYDQAISSNGNIDAVSDHTTQVPSMRFTNKRLLDFVRTSVNSTKADREAMSGYVNQNAEEVINIYVDQAVKRAEYTKFFGVDGKNLEKLLDKASKQGATKEELKTVLKVVNGALGTLGRDTAEWLNDKFNIPLPEDSNSPINRTVQKAMGGILVIQNIRLLALVTFSSIMDPLGIAVRTGDLSLAWKGFKVAALGITEGVDRKTAFEIGAMLGIIDEATGQEALRMEYGGANLGKGKLATVNDTFFKLTGIEKWTKWTRVMATVAAQEFIKKHTGDNKDKNSLRYMQELSLREGDIQLDTKGNIKILTMQERTGKLSLEEIARDDRVRNAMQQMVDDSILRPNSAVRPVWGSDPHFMLIMHLKSFTYAFYEKILKRAALEIDDDNLGSLFGLLFMVPVMLVADFFKDILRNKDNTERRADWGVVDYAAHGVERAGLLGIGTFVNDAATDLKYGNLPWASYAGPTYDILTDIATVDAEVYDFLPASTFTRYYAGDN